MALMPRPRRRADQVCPPLTLFMTPCVDVPTYRTFARDGSSAIALTPLFALRSGSTFFHVRPWLALAKRPLDPPA